MIDKDKIYCSFFLNAEYLILPEFLLLRMHYNVVVKTHDSQSMNLGLIRGGSTGHLSRSPTFKINGQLAIKTKVATERR